MTAMYQKNLEILQPKKEEGRITRQNMTALKAKASVKAPKENPLTKALSALHCFLFRPKFAGDQPMIEEKKAKRKSYNSNNSLSLDF